MTTISIGVAESNLRHVTRLSAHKQMGHFPSTIQVKSTLFQAAVETRFPL